MFVAPFIRATSVANRCLKQTRTIILIATLTAQALNANYGIRLAMATIPNKDTQQR